jgi:Terminase-like family.
MGRRWGKSTLGGSLSLACANAGAKVAWVVPTYKNGRPLWRWAEATVAPVRRLGVDISRSERMISFPSGGFLGIYSADNPTSILGDSFHLVVIDEAARIAEEVWTETLLPTLADYDGRALLISSPRGRNWFYNEWCRGQRPNSEIKSWRAPTSANPNPRIQRAAQLARERIPNAVYRQEWNAEFVEDGLTLFRLVDVEHAEIDAVGDQPKQEGHSYLTSVDIGRRQDATIINTFDTTKEPFQRVAFERLERVPYPVIQSHIERRWKQYGGALVIESNGVGDPVIENLRVPATPFVTSSRTKVQAIEALQLLLEKDRLKAKWDQRERSELVKAAWDDDHTADEIMSLAIGAYQLQNNLDVSQWIQRYQTARGQHADAT